MDDDSKIITKQDECDCCALPLFSIGIGGAAEQGTFDPVGFVDSGTFYERKNLDWADGGYEYYDANPPYKCRWLTTPHTVVQDENIDVTSGTPKTGTLTTTYLDANTEASVCNDAFFALVAVDPDPDVTLTPESPGLYNGIGTYFYSTIDKDGTAEMGKYYFYIPDATPPVPNYIKIVWDIGRVVHPSTGGVLDYTFAEIVETDNEYVFTDTLNYGDENDSRRFSEVFNALSYLQNEANPIVTDGSQVTFIVCNVRVYRSPSAREYITHGIWIESGAVVQKDTWRYEIE